MLTMRPGFICAAAPRINKLFASVPPDTKITCAGWTLTSSATCERALSSSGLQVVVAKSTGASVPDTLRAMELELVGDDRIGIVSTLTKILAERGVSIENLPGGVQVSEIFEASMSVLSSSLTSAP